VYTRVREGRAGSRPHERRMVLSIASEQDERRRVDGHSGKRSDVTCDVLSVMTVRLLIIWK
jgi:hypothetical protein